MKIGLILGSFDPITIGHISIASCLLNNNIVDKIIFVVAKQNPWKTSSPTNFELRVLMCSESVRQLGSKCEISTVESTIDGIAYSYKTLGKIMAENANNELFIVGGTDVMNEIHLWKNFKENIFPYFNFIEIVRSNEPTDFKSDCIIKIMQRTFGDCGGKEMIQVLPTTLSVSSTIVRNMVKEHKNPYPFVNETVAKIIKDFKLYR